MAISLSELGEKIKTNVSPIASFLKRFQTNFRQGKGIIGSSGGGLSTPLPYTNKPKISTAVQPAKLSQPLSLESYLKNYVQKYPTGGGVSINQQALAAQTKSAGQGLRQFYREPGTIDLFDAQTGKKIGATEFGTGAGFKEVSKPSPIASGQTSDYQTSGISDTTGQNLTGLENLSETDLMSLLGITGLTAQEETPTLPVASNEAYKQAYQDYITSLVPSDELKSAKQKYLDYVTNANLGIQAEEGQGRGIPLALVRGRQEKLAGQAETEASRLQGDIDIATAGSTTAQNQALAKLQMEQGLLERAQPKTIEVGDNLFSIDPTTGKFTKLYSPPVSGTDTLDYQKKILEIKKLQTDINNSTSNLDKQLKQADLDKKLKELSGEQPSISPYQEERSVRNLQSIEELLSKAQQNPGIFGRTAAVPIPSYLRSDAYRNFEAELNTLKSNIAFGELTAMREASQTGGALGQVSDKEGQLLQDALGSLSMTQSPQNIQLQLQKIRDSINRWKATVNHGGTSGATGEFDWIE